VSSFPEPREKLTMKRKKTDTVQLSKIRMREELRQKLVKDAERKARTLNGEIVDRLEASYEFDRRTEELKQRELEQVQALQAQLLDNQTKIEQALRTCRELELAVQRAADTQKVIEALIGNNKASYNLIQKVAVEVGTNLEWDRSESGRRSMAEKINAYIINRTNGGSE
jgi:hypothetical protein